MTAPLLAIIAGLIALNAVLILWICWLKNELEASLRRERIG